MEMPFSTTPPTPTAVTADRVEKGFTLIELMVTMAVASVFMMGMYAAFNSQAKIYRKESLVTTMQQNIRGGMEILGTEIRMAGYDPSGSDEFAIEDVTETVPGPYSSISFSYDIDEDGVKDANETITYSIYDAPLADPDGVPDLARNEGGGRQLLAEGIEAIGIAYAVDANNDGQIEFDDRNDDGVHDPDEPFFWLIDSDNDNDLDASLDANDDGAINWADGEGIRTLASINLPDLFPDPDNVALDTIREVRVWMLARTRSSPLQHWDATQYKVGPYVVTPTAATRAFPRRLMECTFHARNMWVIDEES
jgi:type IV pilus assembly protein PilW